MTTQKIPPVVQIVGYSNTGKTTLICHLISHFSQRGWKVGAIKGHAGELEVDQQGKDTWYHREAGADRVSITAVNQTALIFPRPLGLEKLLPLYRGLDLVLVEGFKEALHPKLVMVGEPDHLSLIGELSNVHGVVSSFPVKEVAVPVYRREDPERIAEAVKGLSSILKYG